MTPPRLDRDVVHVRLRRIRDLLRDLDSLGGVDEARLRDEPAVRLAVERVLTLIVDLAVSVNSHVAAAILDEGPLGYADSFRVMARAGALGHEDADELALSAGLRNVLTHQYLDVDLRLVARGAARAPALYRAYIGQVTRFVESRGAGSSGQ